MNRTSKYVFPLLLLINLSSCQDGWGEHFQSFAQNDSKSLSLKHAKANLAQKWIRSFDEGRSKLLMRTALLETGLSAQKVPIKEIAKYSEEDLFAEAAYLVTLKELHIQFILKSEEIEQAIRELNKSCEDRNLFNDLNLSAVLRANILNVAMPEQSTQYMISTDYIETAINAISGLWGGNEYKNQKKKFDDGLKTAMDGIPSEEKLFHLSKRICIHERERYLESLSLLDKHIRLFKERVGQWQNLITKRKEELDYYLTPKLVERVAKKYNFNDFYSYISLQKYQIKFDRDLDRVDAELYDLERNIIESDNELDRLIHQEKLVDQANNILQQLNYFSKYEKRKKVLFSLNFLKNKVESVLSRWEDIK